MPNLDVKQILKAAIQLEENGEKFYRYIAEVAEEQDIKDIFTNLANEERNKHKKAFERLLSKIENLKTENDYSEDYLSYLEAYVDDIPFTNELLEEKLPKIKDLFSAIEFATQRELDTILFYHEIKRFVPEDQHNLIDDIIEEERIHYLRLMGLSKKLKE